MNMREIKNTKPRLIVMVGLSASGKSTTANLLASTHNAQIISSDAIRKELTGSVENQEKNKEVFELFHRRIKDALISGQSVIADATNLTMKSRRAILQNVKNIPCVKEAYITVKPYEDCLNDNKNRPHPVPDYVLKNQLECFEVPFYEEGFDKITIQLPECQLQRKSFQDYFEEMRSFDQHNPHHNENLGDHCMRAMCAYQKYPHSFAFLSGARFHDIGKLFTQTFDEEGVAHYYKHENVGAYFLLSRAYEFVNTYQMDMEEILDAVFLVNYHMKPFSWEEEKTHNKYKRIFGEEKYNILMDFNECDKERSNITYEKLQDIEEERELEEINL